VHVDLVLLQLVDELEKEIRLYEAELKQNGQG